MKHKTLAFVLIAFFLFSSGIAFADDPCLDTEHTYKETGCPDGSAGKTACETSVTCDEGGMVKCEYESFETPSCTPYSYNYCMIEQMCGDGYIANFPCYSEACDDGASPSGCPTGEVCEGCECVSSCPKQNDPPENTLPIFGIPPDGTNDFTCCDPKKSFFIEIAAGTGNAGRCCFYYPPQNERKFTDYWSVNPSGANGSICCSNDRGASMQLGLFDNCCPEGKKATNGDKEFGDVVGNTLIKSMICCPPGPDGKAVSEVVNGVVRHIGQSEDSGCCKEGQNVTVIRKRLGLPALYVICCNPDRVPSFEAGPTAPKFTRCVKKGSETSWEMLMDKADKNENGKLEPGEVTSAATSDEFSDEEKVILVEDLFLNGPVYFGEV